ncbi:MAG: sigma-54-dependent Fis family transcriptional regulator [Candidatus Marinimicrobia bacterium]|nr:sigma-54-dependent Fis family transcriptional regulator [Candidatus Neomarinimicrobiota bacterium]
MRILLVDDDPLSRQSMAKFLSTYLEHDVSTAEAADEAWDMFQKEPFPLTITDIRMPGMNGLDLLEKIKSHETGIESDVVLMTGFGELESAIEALRLGATDYLQKPVNVDQLAMVVSNHESKLKSINKDKATSALPKETIDVASETKHSEHQLVNVFDLGLIGIFSSEMRDVAELTEMLHEDRNVNVLIRGETGTGKEVVARMVHFKEGEELLPFITLNCSAITPSLFESELFGYEPGAFTGAKRKGQSGKLELAQGGTLFLDEIGDLPIDMQPKLLRALQMKEMYRLGGGKKIKLDVRLICATNRGLEEMIDAGSFRRDLYYRLNTASIEVPALKDRKADIGPLIKLFLEEFSAQKKKRFQLVHPSVVAILENHSWPGNVRELRNLIERAVLLHDAVELRSEHLSRISPKSISDKLEKPAEMRLRFKQDKYPYDELEQDIIKLILEHFDGNKSKAAEYLGITRNRINRKLTPLL